MTATDISLRKLATVRTAAWNAETEDDQPDQRNMTPLRASWSVVIPCCQPEPRRLREAISSALDAGCQPHNLVLVRDEPENEQLDAVVRAFPDIRLVRHRKSQGVARARHTGLGAVTTEFVTFLDQDDYFTSAMTDALREANKNRAKVAVVGNMDLLDTQSGCITSSHIWHRKATVWTDAGLDLMFENAQLGRWVVPTNVARKCQFLTTVGIADDRVFVSQLAAVADVVAIPKSVLVYRRHSKQTSARATLNESQISVLEHTLASAAKQRFSEAAVRRRVRAARCYWKVIGLGQGKNQHQMLRLKYLILAAQRDPTLLMSSVCRSGLTRTAGSILKQPLR